MKPSTRIPRKKKKMALYEVFNKGMSNSRRRQELESRVTGGTQVQRTQTKPRAGSTGSPQAIQFNRGRVEISLRYDLAIVLGLLALVCLMGAYRLGEHMSIKESESGQVKDAAPASAMPTVDSTTVTEAVETERTADETESISSGDNWIVIATHQSEGQLAPVQQYFEGCGIETQIRKVAGVYILHTKQSYGNPNRSGSDGERILRQIVELGRKYEPPSGYKSFDFTTAYGMKKLN
jgi:hypothetical protein